MVQNIRLVSDRVPHKVVSEAERGPTSDDIHYDDYVSLYSTMSISTQWVGDLVARELGKKAYEVCIGNGQVWTRCPLEEQE